MTDYGLVTIAISSPNHTVFFAARNPSGSLFYLFCINCLLDYFAIVAAQIRCSLTSGYLPGSPGKEVIDTMKSNESCTTCGSTDTGYTSAGELYCSSCDGAALFLGE